MNELKPCPFCGAIPTLEWEPWTDISPTSGIYYLECNHANDCYITHINGMNPKGRSSASNRQCLEDWWNRRTKT